MITGHFVYTGIARFACHQYQAGKGCLHFANTEHFKGFFSLFFLTLAQRKHVFFASSLLSNCMRSRILSNYLNQNARM